MTVLIPYRPAPIFKQPIIKMSVNDILQNIIDNSPLDPIVSENIVKVFEVIECYHAMSDRYDNDIYYQTFTVPWRIVQNLGHFKRQEAQPTIRDQDSGLYQPFHLYIVMEAVFTDYRMMTIATNETGQLIVRIHSEENICFDIQRTLQGV